MELKKSDTRIRLEKALFDAAGEITKQLGDLTELRETKMFPHPNKLATATAALNGALVKACAELRQQEKHKQANFEAMSPDERNGLLLHHLDELDEEWRERFLLRLQELSGEVGLLG